MTQAGTWHGTAPYLHSCAPSPSSQIQMIRVSFMGHSQGHLGTFSAAALNTRLTTHLKLRCLSENAVLRFVWAQMEPGAPEALSMENVDNLFT